MEIVTDSKDLSIIIVNWNSKEYIKKCITSILSMNCKVEYEILVVDNASFDGCDEMLRHNFPKVHFIQSNRNIGFARANNLAFNFCKGNNILFLNPDTEIKGKAIDCLFDSVQEIPDAGIIGCRLLNSDGSLQMSCVQSFPTLLNQVLDAEILRKIFPKSKLWGNRSVFDMATKPVEVDSISGACMMVSRRVFNLVGGFSSDFFMYGEDLDLCHKVRRAGFKNYYLNKATVVHYGGGASVQAHSRFSVVMMRESVNHFLRKSKGRMYGKYHKILLISVAITRLFLLIITWPIYFTLGKTSTWNGSVLKWFFILRWGIGLELWTKQYENLQPANTDSYSTRIT